MKRKLGSLLVGAGAVTLAVLGIPAATAISGASGPPASPGAPTAHTFTVTPSGTTARFVATTHFMATETATGTQATGGGTHGLTPRAEKQATIWARVPDIDGFVGKGDNIGGAPGPRGIGQQRPPATAPKIAPAAAAALSRTAPTATRVTSTVSPSLASTGGINAYDEGLLHPVYATGTAQPLPGVDVEPPDQGLCSNGSVIMEVNNEVMQVFNASTLAPLGGNGMALENLFKTPEIFGGTGHSGVNVQGDPRCIYDPVSGHWFASQLWLDESGKLTSYGWSGFFIAVSVTSNPMGAWKDYFVPDMNDLKATTTCSNLPLTTFGNGANPCFGDQPLLGMNANSVYVSTNEYSLYTGSLGGVANVYFLSKEDLISGKAAPIYWAHPGDIVPRPTAGTCPFGSPTALHCPWYSLAPANSAGSYLTVNRGTFYALSGVTFTTTGGNRAAEWQFTNTGATTTAHSQILGAVHVVNTVTYTEPAMATQKAGPVPLGHFWRLIADMTTGHPYNTTRPMPEGPIATNTDRMTTAAYDPATGALWGGLNTGITFETHKTAGIVWVSVTPKGVGQFLSASAHSSGYLAATGTNVQFPAIAFTTSGMGIMDYSLSGSANYPSTAYSMLGAHGPSSIQMARPGAGPEDGFTEYQFKTTATSFRYRPRWGDYSTAVAAGTTFYFATEMINQSCSVATFATTFTCGATRDLQANWGTSVNKLSA